MQLRNVYTKFSTFAAQICMAANPLSSSMRNKGRRQLLLRLLRTQAKHITFERNGLTWTAPVTGAVTHDLFLGQQHQGESFKKLISVLSHKSTEWSRRGWIINVGSNIGDTAIPLAIETRKRIIAVEPVSETYQMLVANISTNQLTSQITPIHAAISSTPGDVTMAITSDAGMNEVLVSGKSQGFHGGFTTDRVESINGVTLNTLINGMNISPSDVAVVWSDTQGYESSVILSGDLLWKSGVMLWAEFWPPGLEAHGGIRNFVEVCAMHFNQYIPDWQLDEDVMLPVSDMTTLVDKLRKRGRTFVDILLIP